MQLRDQRRVKVEYERRTHWSPVFDNNPRIARWDDIGDFQHYQPRVNGLRPYCTAKSETKWVWTDYKPHVGELFFTPQENYFASWAYKPEIVVEPSVKKSASPNKDWGWERWQELVELLNGHKLRVVQLGPPRTKVLGGATLIPTDSFRLAAAVLARARGAVLPEGGLHHAAAAVGVPAVVIYGGFISPAQTGYDMHTNLFTGGVPCGNRMRCSHCEKAMAHITPKMVFEELKKRLGS